MLEARPEAGSLLVTDDSASVHVFVPDIFITAAQYLLCNSIECDRGTSTANVIPKNMAWLVYPCQAGSLGTS
jgi:hypothetical protein